MRKVLLQEIEKVKGNVSSSGVQGAVNELSKTLGNPELAKVVERLYLEVGLRYARRTWRSLKEQERASRKPRRISKASLLQGVGLATRSKGDAKIDKQGEPDAKRLAPSLETKGFGFNSVWVDFLKNYLFRFLLEKITYRVAESTREALLNVLNQSIEEGWGMEKTLKQLDDLPLSRTQAARIVRTEVTRAANTGAMAAGETFEYEQQKEWIAARDLRTRGRNPEDHASHVGLDGQVVDYDQPFTDPRNGDKLMFPGDPKASAASTIQCRCSVAITAKYDENFRLIPKIK